MKKKVIRNKKRISCLTCDAQPFTEPKSRETAQEKVLAPIVIKWQQLLKAFNSIRK